MDEQTATGDQFKRGRQLLRSGDFVSAMEVLNQYVATNPDDAAAFEALGTAYFAGGDDDGALQAFQRAAQLVPREVRVFVNLGAVHNRRGEYQQALEILRKALQKDRKSADAYYNMGLAHRGLDQLKMAVSAYREAIRLNPEMAEAYQNLGNVYFAMGNHTQAITNLQRALELRPKIDRAQRGLEQAEAALAEQRNPGTVLERVAGPGTKSVAAADASQKLIPPDDLQMILSTVELASDVSRDLVAGLLNRFRAALKSLSKAVADHSDSPLLVDEHLEAFRAVVGEILPHFQEVDVRVRQIETLASGDLQR